VFLRYVIDHIALLVNLTTLDKSCLATQAREIEQRSVSRLRYGPTRDGRAAGRLRAARRYAAQA
jgi:hypothetical protein